MTTVTIKINASTRKTQYLLGLIGEIAKNDKNIEISKTEDGPYNPEFVKDLGMVTCLLEFHLNSKAYKIPSFSSNKSISCWVLVRQK